MASTPRLAYVDIQPAIGNNGHLVVEPVWDGVDRPRVGGWVVRDMRTAKRLEACLRDGNCYSAVRLATDMNGQTYAATTARVMGRHMNADLRRLGY
jgi:hypothetical protein